MEFEKRVKETIERFNLLKRNDKVFVAVSGGKDSTTLLYVLHKLGYDVTGVTVDSHIPDYSGANLSNIRRFTSELDIPLIVVSFKEVLGLTLDEALDKLEDRGNKLSACTVCGIMKRSILNKLARKKGATVIATGHNMDDEAHVFLMNLMKGNVGLSAKMGPESGLVRYEGFIRRVKPLYLIREAEAKAFSQKMGFPVKYEECPRAERAYRRQIRLILREFEAEGVDVVPSVIEHFLEIKPKLMRFYATDELPGQCIECGEPSKGERCRACQLIEMLSSQG